MARQPVSLPSILNVINWENALKHYDYRLKIHQQLLQLHANGQITRFAKLLVGVSNPDANFSASQHGLGPLILGENRNVAQRLFDIAGKFLALKNGRDVPDTIRNADLKYFKIAVGSEASCMLNPKVCWISNTRTIWVHLVFKHEGDRERANEELKLYRDDDETSEMAYKKWMFIHRAMAGNLTMIIDEGSALSRKASVKPGQIRYLWADAIANTLYEYYQ